MRKLLRYTGTAMFFHWFIALLIVVNVGLTWAVDDDAKATATSRAIIDFHKSTGLLILVLMLLRLVWRATHIPPALPATYKPWEVALTHAAHLGLYAVALALPLTGWAHDEARSVAVAAQYPLHVYGQFAWPHLGFIADLPPDVKQIWHKRLGHLHSLLADVLYVLVGLHVLGALKHQWIDKELELQRILPWGG